MEKSSKKTIFVCQQCGKEELKWLGRCPSCQEWNTFIEKAAPSKSVTARTFVSTEAPRELSDITIDKSERYSLPLAEFNRVVGGGVVPGSLTLIGGEPGIGKSTLLLQVSALVAQAWGKVVYVSGEETIRQIKLRAGRLGINGNNLYLLTETNLESVLEQAEQLQPALLVIDSIQTIEMTDVEGITGSITQVRQCTQRLMQWSKMSGVPVFVAGHVTKEGAIAGPRVLEHIVDVVLYLEGEQFSAYRLLRCVKNRFGSTNEIGVFEMKQKGLIEVENPSLVFLSRHTDESIGSAVVPILEGSRPLLVEIQALTNQTTFGLPRRTTNGVDFNRVLMIAAVLSRRLGLALGNQDIMVNVTGGLKVGEPAADLGIAIAIASSFRDSSVDPHLAVVGEIGLSGELRAVSQLERRVSEAARLGFKRVLVPKAGGTVKPVPKGIEIITAGTVREAVAVGVRKK